MLDALWLWMQLLQLAARVFFWLLTGGDKLKAT